MTLPKYWNRPDRLTTPAITMVCVCIKRICTDCRTSTAIGPTVTGSARRWRCFAPAAQEVIVVCDAVTPRPDQVEAVEALVAELE